MSTVTPRSASDSRRSQPRECRRVEPYGLVEEKQLGSEACPRRSRDAASCRRVAPCTRLLPVGEPDFLQSPVNPAAAFRQAAKNVEVAASLNVG